MSERAEELVMGWLGIGIILSGLWVVFVGFLVARDGFQHAAAIKTAAHIQESVK